MKTNFVDFLIDLALDPCKYVEFKDDPDTAMERADLSKEEMAALKSGDSELVRRYIFWELGIKYPYPSMHTMVIVETEDEKPVIIRPTMVVEIDND